MPGLYGLSSNANVAVSNTTGLYINSGASPILNNAQQLLALLSNNGTVIFALDPATGYSKVEAFATGSGGGSGNLIINLTGDVTAFGSTGNATPTTLSNTGVTAGTYGSGNRYFPSITIDSKGRITSATTQDVAAFLPSYAGQLAAIQPASIITQGTGGITTFGNLSANNASITSKLSAATITITQGIFWANGAPVFNYSNANVAAYLPTYQGNIGTLRTGNISTGNLYVDNIFSTGNVTYSNVVIIPSVASTLYANANINSTSPNTGAIISAGGLGVNYDMFVGGNLNIANTGDVSANIGKLFAGNLTTNANLGAYQTYANTQIQTITANLGAYQIFANANAATQQTQINNLVTQANANTAAYLLGNTQQGNIRANTINLGPFGNFGGNPNYSGVLNIQGGTGFLGYGANLILTSNLGTDAAGYAYATIGSTVNNLSTGQPFATGTPAQTILTGNILIPKATFFGPNAFINNTLLTPTNQPVGVFEGNVYFNFYTGTTNRVQFNSNVNLIGGSAALNLGSGANIFVRDNGNISVASGGYFLGDGSKLTGITGSYGNTQVAAYLPTYTGNLSPGNLLTNNIRFANGQPYTFGTTYSNVNVAAYIPTDPTITGIQANLGSYQTYANTQIQSINANLGSYQTYANTQIQTTNANLGAYQTFANANAATQATSINTINANLGAFQTYANATFSTSTYGNTQVAAYLPVYNGNILASNILFNDGTYQTALSSTLATGFRLNTANGPQGGNLVIDASGAVITGKQNADSASVTVNGGQSWVLLQSRSDRTWTFGATLPDDTLSRSSATFPGNLKLNTGGIVFSDGSYLNTATLGSYGNTQVAAYLPTDPTFTGYLTFANANAATQTTAINAINANLGAYQTYGNLTFSTVANAASQQTQIDTNTSGIATLNANLGAYQTYANTQIQSLNANLGGFETWANINLNYYTNTNAAAFLASMGANNISTTGNITAARITATTLVTTPQLESLTDLDINTPGVVNVNANLRVGDNNTATQISTHGTGDLILRTHNGDANQGNIRLYNGTNGNIDVQTNGTGTINLRGAVNTTDGITATGNITASYVIANASKMTSLTGVSAGTYGSDTVIPTIVVDTTGRITQITTNAISGGGSYGNANVAAYLAGTITVGNILSTNGYYWANGAAYSTGGGSTYGNTQVAAYLPTDPTFTGYLTFANANAALQQTSIDNINANLGSYQTYANTQIQTINANLGAYQTYGNTQIQTINANLGAFQTYANATFVTTSNQYGNTQVAAYLPTYDGNIGGFLQTYVNATKVTSATGFFWSNGTAYSTGGGTAFTGNLDGNPLYDSVNERVIANAFPLSTGNVSIPGNGTARFIVHNPVYTNGVLQQPPLANATVGGTGIVAISSQVVGMVQSANIGFQSGYGFGSQNRDTLNFLSQTTVTPVTANNMSNNDRIRGGAFSLDLNMNGQTYGTMSTTSQGATTVAGLNAFVNVNGSGNVSTAVGGVYGSFITPAAGQTANIQYSSSVLSFLTLQATAGTGGRANVVYHRGLAPFIAGMSANLTVQNAVGLHTYSGWAGSGLVGTSGNPVVGRWAVLNEDANTLIQTNGNLVVTGNTSLGPIRETQATLGNQTGTITVNYWSGTVQTATLTGNVTLNTNNVTNMPTGGTVTLILRQDSTGSRLLTSNIKFAGGSKTLSTAASAIDTITIYNDGTDLLASLVKGYS